MVDHVPPVSGCCDSSAACVFSKALLAQQAGCTLATRRDLGEQLLLECRSPLARTNCGTLAALMHERARFALRLPPPGRPLIHVHAMRLQCGGLAALQRVLECDGRDVHQMVGLAHERHGSLTELPWRPLVGALVEWQPRRRRPATGAMLDRR